MSIRRHPITVSSRQDPLASVPLDDALIARLRNSYESVRSSGDQLALRFYTRLFEAAPGLRQRFPTDIDGQARKLIAALDAVVANLAEPGANAEMLSELGRRHRAYGATPAHYALVVRLLVESMGEILGVASDDPALEEWRCALELIARQMIRASSEAP